MAGNSLSPKRDLYQEVTARILAELERARLAPNAVIAVLARQAAIKAVKRQLQDRGVRPHHLKPREIKAMADAYLAQHREALIAETWEKVRSAPSLCALYEKEQRDRLRQIERNSKQMHSAGSPAAQGVSVCKTHAQNGGVKYLTSISYEPHEPHETRV